MPPGMSSSKFRFHRLFGPDGKCFDVAIDHGFFNEFGFLSGIEDLASAVRTVVEAGPDAIQLTIGQARRPTPVALMPTHGETFRACRWMRCCRGTVP